MQTSTKSFTLLELLATNLPNGQKATITTDNDLYGITVIKQDDALINQRTGCPMVMTSDFIKAKFKLIDDQPKEVDIAEFVAAYELGKQVKVTLNGASRILRKRSDLPPGMREFLEAASPVRAQIATQDEVLMIQELAHGKFYIL